MKSTQVILLVSATLALAGCVNREAQKEAKETQEIVTSKVVPVEVSDATTQDMPESIELTGSITTDADVEIGAKSGGRLVAVYIKDGDSVRAGQVIAQQETADANARVRQLSAMASAARSQLHQALTEARVSPSKTSAAIRASEARVRQARAALDKLIAGSRTEERRQAEANVRRAKSDLETAEKNLRRVENLVREGALARVDLEAAQNRYQTMLAAYDTALQQQQLVLNATRPEDIESAREAVRAAEEQLKIDRANKQLDPLLQQRVDAARANVLSAEEQVVSARQALSDLTIRSSFNGRVSGKPLAVGTYAGPGTVVARVIGGDGVYYEAQVTETQVGQLRPGMPVTVKLDALPGVTIQGKVGTTNPIASDIGRLFNVRVMLVERLDSLKPGMFAHASVLIGTKRNVVTVPERAVIRDGQTAYLFVVEGGKAKRMDVKLGGTSDGRIEVSGVNSGAKVVIRGQTTLVDGTEVSTGSEAKAESAEGEKAGS